MRNGFEMDRHQKDEKTDETINRVIHSNDDAFVSIVLKEYEALWEEILERREMQRDVLKLQITVVTALVAGVNFFENVPILYLFGSTILGILSWIIVEQTVRIQGIYVYINDELSQTLKDRLSLDKPAFGWLQYFYKPNFQNSVAGFLSIIKFLVGFLLAILFISLFLLNKNTLPWTIEEMIVFWLSVLIIVLPLILVLANGISVISRIGRNKKNINS
jgi:hypothetical protein